MPLRESRGKENDKVICGDICVFTKQRIFEAASPGRIQVIARSSQNLTKMYPPLERTDSFRLRGLLSGVR